MNRTAHQAAIDQANLLAAYLADTPTSSLDLAFIRRHLWALDDFATAAHPDGLAAVTFDRAVTSEPLPARAIHRF